MDSLKSNKTLIIGLFSLLGIFFVSHGFIIYEYSPELKGSFFIMVDNLRWILLLSVMLISLIFLHLKNKKKIIISL